MDGMNLQKVDSLRFPLVFVLIIRPLGKITVPTYQINCVIVYTHIYTYSIAIIYMASHVLDTKAMYCLKMQYFDHILIIVLKYGKIFMQLPNIYNKKSYANCLYC